MLVCNVSLLRRRAAIAADVAETAAALDAPGTGNVVFAALVDDPASVGELVDAFLGEVMLEAASAADTMSAGMSFDGQIAEATTAADVSAASKATVSAITFDPPTAVNAALSNGNLTATATGTSGFSGARVAPAAALNTGKFYFEFRVVATTGTSNAVGLLTPAGVYGDLIASNTNSLRVVVSNGVIATNGSNLVVLGAFAAGDVVGIAIDLGAHLLWCRKNAGNWNNSGTANPATATGGLSFTADTYGPVAAWFSNAVNDAYTLNVGATAYANAAPSGFGNWTAGGGGGGGGGSGTASFDGAASNVTLSNGGLTVTHPNTSPAGAGNSIFNTDGKFYFEITTSVSISSGNSFGVMGLADSVTSSPADAGCNKVAVLMGSSSLVYQPVGSNTGKNLGTASVGDIWAAAIDLHNGLAWFRRNGGTWNGDASANPATGVGGVAFSVRATYAPFVSFAGGANATDVMTANFGATAFTGTPPSGFGNWA